MTVTERIPLHKAAKRSGVQTRTMERILAEEGIEIPSLGRRRVRFVSVAMLENVLQRRSAREAQAHRIPSRRAL